MNGPCVPKDLYDRCIRRFVPSTELIEHLIANPVSTSEFIEVILGSPKSLTAKLTAFEELADAARESPLSTGVPAEIRDARKRIAERRRLRVWDLTFDVCVEEISKALDALALDIGEVLILGEKSHSIDPSGFGGAFGYWGFAPFLSYEALHRHIDAELQDCSEDDLLNNLFWYEIEKWIPRAEGFMHEEYCYVLIGNEIAYFDHRVPDERCDPAEDYGWSDIKGFDDSRGLSVPIPYNEGDIVKLDCRPFAPLRYGCLYDFWGHGYGEIEALVRNQQGLWISRSLGWNSCIQESDHLSVLYRIEKVEGPLPEADRLLYEVQRFVDGSHSNAELLWERMMERANGLTDDELRTVIEECRNHK